MEVTTGGQVAFVATTDPSGHVFDVTTGGHVACVATTLPSGHVFVVGGHAAFVDTTDPSGQVFDEMTGGHVAPAATTLPSEQVLVVGGQDALASTTLPSQQVFVVGGQDAEAATTLPSQQVLVFSTCGHVWFPYTTVPFEHSVPSGSPLPPLPPELPVPSRVPVQSGEPLQSPPERVPPPSELYPVGAGVEYPVPGAFWAAVAWAMTNGAAVSVRVVVAESPGFAAPIPQTRATTPSANAIAAMRVRRLELRTPRGNFARLANLPARRPSCARVIIRRTSLVPMVSPALPRVQASHPGVT
ncbi:hypothetical protein [Nocardia yamanashiensis]|uniref:hypothetical protein n=1 Tax=Nocardia yamanashiensis TaxID=209247 RepID=UPI0012FDA8FE|nr:hypothetical protein [Nocardia yamanashiensis]